MQTNNALNNTGNLNSQNQPRASIDTIQLSEKSSRSNKILTYMVFFMGTMLYSIVINSQQPKPAAVPHTASYQQQLHQNSPEELVTEADLPREVKTLDKDLNEDVMELRDKLQDVLTLPQRNKE